MSSIVDLLAVPGTTLILDGAMATELEKLGANLNDPLWSCKTLLEQPHLIRSVHLAYFKVGADIATTASYQATDQGLMEQKGMPLEEAKTLIRKSVTLAQEAREEVSSSPEGNGRSMFVAGSVGPYGAYLADGSEYRGKYSLAKEAMKAFHRPRIEALVEAGVDLIAIETMPSFQEIDALVALVKEEYPSTPAWISCSSNDGKTMCDGTPIGQICELARCCPSIFAVGVNCCSPELVTPAIIEFAKFAALSQSFVCYPNSGETWDASSNTWIALDELGGRGWNELVKEWTLASKVGKIIGGCCRTGPDDIRDIKTAVESLRSKR